MTFNVSLRRFLTFLAALSTLGAAPLVAQETPVQEASSYFADAPLEPEISPAGAFLRGLVLPGWGHVGSQAYARGGFYVAAQTGTLWMLGKAILRRSEAARYSDMEREVARERLLFTGVDPLDIPLRVDGDPAVVAWEELRESRGQQVEDWAAAAIFLSLLGAVDAFVAAHLQNYPEPLTMTVTPGAPGEGWQLGLRVPTGRKGH